jgi:hypothetical protein
MNSRVLVASSTGVSVINASPLGMGLMTTAGGMDWHPAPPKVRDACRLTAQAVSVAANGWVHGHIFF